MRCCGRLEPVLAPRGASQLAGGVHTVLGAALQEVVVNALGTARAGTSYADCSVEGPVLLREIAFLDFTVDAVPLRGIVAVRRQVGAAPSEMTALGSEWPWPELAVATLRRLLGKEPGDFEDGRVALLVCPVDADLGCGALSATLAFGDDWVEWRQVGWQNDEEPFDPPQLGLEPTENGLEPTVTFRFGRTAYTEVLQGLLTHFEQLVVGHLRTADVSTGVAHDVRTVVAATRRLAGSLGFVLARQRRRN